MCRLQALCDLTPYGIIVRREREGGRISPGLGGRGRERQGDGEGGREGGEGGRVGSSSNLQHILECERNCDTLLDSRFLYFSFFCGDGGLILLDCCSFFFFF